MPLPGSPVSKDCMNLLKEDVTDNASKAIEIEELQKQKRTAVDIPKRFINLSKSLQV